MIIPMGARISLTAIIAIPIKTHETIPTQQVTFAKALIFPPMLSNISFLLPFSWHKKVRSRSCALKNTALIAATQLSQCTKWHAKIGHAFLPKQKHTPSCALLLSCVARVLYSISPEKTTEKTYKTAAHDLSSSSKSKTPPRRQPWRGSVKICIKPRCPFQPDISSR